METYTITTVDDPDSPYYTELEELIKEFALNVFVFQNFKLSKEERYRYIENYTKLLSMDDLIHLEKDVEERLKALKESLTTKNPFNETRYYVLLKDNEVIGFQTAQVKSYIDRIEGWRNFAYMKRNHMGRTGTVKSTYDDLTSGFLSEQLYKNISKWFLESGVTVERTATGTNMMQNIFAYIVYKGFIPDGMDKQRVYLKKEYSNKHSKVELLEEFEKYVRTRK